MLCATCGKPLSEKIPTADGYIVTIKADDGMHHGPCWGKQRADRIAEIEAALCRIAYMHQEIDAGGAHEKMGRAQAVAMRAIEHIAHATAQKKAEEHHAAERHERRMFRNEKGAGSAD